MNQSFDPSSSKPSSNADASENSSESYVWAKNQDDLIDGVKPNQSERSSPSSFLDDSQEETNKLIVGRKSKTRVTKYKKAPDAPRRFKSAFIFFSTEKHREIRENIKKTGQTEKTTNVAKMVSEAWKNLDAKQRAFWDEKARLDRVRYEVEVANYNGPWKVPARRAKKDPKAPKRPMSAFLSFSNGQRMRVMQENPEFSQAEVSGYLSRLWKEAPEHVRKEYTDKEHHQREEYKIAIAEWRKNDRIRKAAEREEREAVAMKVAKTYGVESLQQIEPRMNQERRQNRQCDRGEEAGERKTMPTPKVTASRYYHHSLLVEERKRPPATTQERLSEQSSFISQAAASTQQRTQQQMLPVLQTHQQGENQLTSSLADLLQFELIMKQQQEQQEQRRRQQMLLGSTTLGNSFSRLNVGQVPSFLGMLGTPSAAAAVPNNHWLQLKQQPSVLGLNQQVQQNQLDPNQQQLKFQLQQLQDLQQFQHIQQLQQLNRQQRQLQHGSAVDKGIPEEDRQTTRPKSSDDRTKGS